MLLNFNIELHATQVVCFCWLNFNIELHDTSCVLLLIEL